MPVFPGGAQVPQNRRGCAAGIQSPLCPRFDPVRGDSTQWVRKPTPEVPLEYPECIGRRWRTVALRPTWVCLLDELPRRRPVKSIEAKSGTGETRGDGS